MVGVSASPGSAIIIAGMLLVALALRWLLAQQDAMVQASQLQHAAAVTIILGSLVTGAACIANDNVQDLKVGHILGATPWKQQVMLLLGVLVASAVTPLVMQLLYKVYGIAGNVPNSNMDISASLPAPPAALMAAVTQAVFNHDLPWNMLGLGMMVTLFVIASDYLLSKRGLGLSVLAVAIGMYLPLTTSTPLFLGGLMAYISRKGRGDKQRGSLLACGLVAGSALMDVVLAIPLVVLANPHVLNIMPSSLSFIANALGVLVVLALGFWFYRLAQR